MLNCEPAISDNHISAARNGMSVEAVEMLPDGTIANASVTRSKVATRRF
jgi:hypothetical protein